MTKITIESQKKVNLNLPKDTETLNGVIVQAGVDIAGHFGNCVGLRLEIQTEDGWTQSFMAGYNLTPCIGYIVKAVWETLTDGSDDTLSFSRLDGKPCRVLVSDNKVTGIGAFMTDRWLTVEQVLASIKEKEK